jgi:DNA-binding NtrC family response regulator
MRNREQKLHVLIVDDEHANELAEAFQKFDSVATAGCLSEAIEALRKIPDIIILDVMFPKESGAAGHGFMAGHFLDELEKHCRGKATSCPPVLLVSGQSEAAKRFDLVAGWLMEGRIRDILPKTMADIGWEFFQAVLRHKVDSIREEFAWKSVHQHLKAAQVQMAAFGIITCSPKMFAVWETIINPNWKGMSRPVLIYGETGTGKELIANAIHQLSRRGNGPFVAFNVRAVSETVLESELFGHVKGGFSGATAERTGYFEAANCGTIFIDEIAKMPQSMQEKLLRALEYGRIRKVGATDETQLDVRIVGATNRRLEDEVKAGRFLEDLYYRINVLNIDLPPLRARQEDIPWLMDHYLEKQPAAASGSNGVEVDSEVVRCFERYPWPGNVRELKNALDRIIAKSRPGETLLTLTNLRERFSENELPLIYQAPSLPPASPGAGELPDQLLTDLRTGDVALWMSLTADYRDQVIGSVRRLLNTIWDRPLEDMGEGLSHQTNPDPFYYYKVLLYFCVVAPQLQVVKLDDVAHILPLGKTQATKVLKGLAGIRDNHTVDCYVVDNPFLAPGRVRSALAFQLRPGLV